MPQNRPPAASGGRGPALLADGGYSYDDMPSGQTDPRRSHLSSSHDPTDILPLIGQTRQLDPSLKVMGTPWSAPPWMKDNDTFSRPGRLEAQYYGAYAQYFVKYTTGQIAGLGGKCVDVAGPRIPAPDPAPRSGLRHPVPAPDPGRPSG